MPVADPFSDGPLVAARHNANMKALYDLLDERFAYGRWLLQINIKRDRYGNQIPIPGRDTELYEGGADGYGSGGKTIDKDNNQDSKQDNDQDNEQSNINKQNSDQDQNENRSTDRKRYILDGLRSILRSNPLFK